MSSRSMSLKAKIKNYAKHNNIAAQVVLQNYMFERLLERLSLSDYQQQFVVKGGLLIAAIVGLDTRSTMDLDLTLRKLSLSEQAIMEAINSICNIELNDGVRFDIISISPIRKDDQYGGFCVRLNAIYEKISTPLSIDISTGYIITPDAVEYEFRGIFDNMVNIKLWGYNIETVMAEKLETILSRGVFNTRPRDYYDIYILETTQEYDKRLLNEAVLATTEYRSSRNRLRNIEVIISQITNNLELRLAWEKYQKAFAYAKEISYDSTITAIRRLLESISL